MLFLFILLLFEAELFPAWIVITLAKEFGCILSILTAQNFYEPSKEDELFDLGRLKLYVSDVKGVADLRKFTLDISQNFEFRIIELQVEVSFLAEKNQRFLPKSVAEKDY